MKKKISFLFLIMFLFFPLGVFAAEYDCEYELKSNNGTSVTKVGYNIGEGKIHIISWQGNTSSKVAKSSSDNKGSYDTDKCYSNISIKQDSRQQTYSYSFKLGNNENDVKMADGAKTLKLVDKSKNNNSNKNNQSNTSKVELAVEPVDLCDPSKTSLKAFQVIGYLILIAKIVVPMILIILGSITFAKAAMSNDEKSTKDAAVMFGKKILIGLVIFFIPTILDFGLSLINGVSDTAKKYENCTSCVFNPNNPSRCNPVNIVNQ